METCNGDEKVEPGNLLEECWFFGNSLNSDKTKISRSNSDHCPSLDGKIQENMLVRSEKSSSSTTKHTKGGNIVSPKLLRAPSLPSSVAREVEINQEKESNDSGITKSNVQSSPRNNLIRAPSLPICVRKEEEDDEDQESEFTLGRLIRQASLNSSHSLPPRTPKGSRFPRQHRPRKKDMEGSKEMGRRYPISQTMVGESPSDLQREDVQDFKEPWHVKGSAPNWADKQDMKAEIKFWARAVASNVRPPEA